MITFKKGRPAFDEPCTWNYLQDKKSWSASLCCPNGHYGVLLDHGIDNDGNVSPSVVCPAEGCTFHDYVKLDGWGKPEVPAE